jgi:murein DD-endopeptidase MepM/ murein hydrolase activator NlpD
MYRVLAVAGVLAAAPAARADVADVTQLTTQPVADVKSSGFGWRDDPIRHRPRFHGGTDFKADPGTPVLAAGDGVVIFAGRLGGYGNVVYVDHGGGLVTRYAHLRKIKTHRDAVVTAGDEIGQVGATGRTTGPHLHFEVRIAGVAVDPPTAMLVATLERDAPALGWVAAHVLSPEVQGKVSDAIDPPHGGPRPQILW